MAIQTNRRNLLKRLLLPLAIVLVWLVAAGIGGPYFGRINEVSSNDLSTFLPKNSESTRVRDELSKIQDSSTIPAIVVFESPRALTAAQSAQLDSLRTTLANSPGVKGDISKPIVADDQRAAFLLVPFGVRDELGQDISALQTAVQKAATGLDYKLTGPAMFSRDLNKAFEGIDGTLLFVALGAVFLILLVVYRSPILPVVTLMGSMMALSAAILLVWHLAKADIVQLNGQVQGILFILVIGATTDYALLYIARYREEIARRSSAWQATAATWKSTWEPIVAAGGTVSIGLLCLLASDLGSNKALGPVGGIGVVFAIFSALTFLPAALLLLGRTAFWPRRPQYGTSTDTTDFHRTHPGWAKVGRFVGRHPRRLWVGITVVLLAFCFFIPSMKASGVSQENLVLGKSEARDGQAILDRHFPAGSGSPATVLVPAAEQDDVVRILDANRMVDGVSLLTTDKSKGSAPVGKLEAKIKKEIATAITAQQPALAGSPQLDALVTQAYPFSDATPATVDGKVVLQATLRASASSPAARNAVQQLRTSIHAKHPDVLIGGVSAIQLDTNNASTRDLKVIIPLILTAITIILMLLLRAIVAPLLLLATTVLSFGATIGIAALMFNHVWHFAGADPAVIIFGFVFLVALGIDYNIFLMTRVREETIHLGVRTGTIKAVAVTGGVITSAGIVLAATFAALYVIPILFLAEIAFIVAFGVLLDTLVVRSLLVPALTLQVGRRMWWPSKLSRETK
jgi:RND superfamily putative drug exporter